MTTPRIAKATCSVCGSENNFTGIASTNEMGSPDLDTRPPEMKRSTMFAWVQRCPDCGYCATDVSTPLSISSSIVRSEDYQSRLRYPTFPELANTFLCQSLLTRESGELFVSAMASMHAAWDCDDGDYAMQARACRLQAAELFRMAEENGKSISERAGVATAIRVDLLRRAGALDKAHHLVAMDIDGTLDDVIKRILSFQSALLERDDTDRHTIEEAMTGER